MCSDHRGCSPPPAPEKGVRACALARSYPWVFGACARASGSDCLLRALVYAGRVAPSSLPSWIAARKDLCGFVNVDLSVLNLSPCSQFRTWISIVSACLPTARSN